MKHKRKFWEKHPQLTKQINQNFIIRVYLKIEGKTHEHLVGAGQIEKYIEEEQAKELFERALDSIESKTKWWDRKCKRIEIVVK
jgi:hypothetical protein